jgi:hypothetical protein
MQGMPGADGTIRVFNPTGKPPAPGALSDGGRREGRAEFVIGFMDNHKHNSAKILARLEERFLGLGMAMKCVRAKKPEAGKPAPKELIAKLAAECHAVVTGVAD